MRLSRRHLMAGLAGLSVAGPTRAETSAADEIIAAEIAFDAYTAVHGYTRGFLKYSALDAVGFNPTIFLYHQHLMDEMSKTPPPPEEPSKLRWWPYRVGVSRTGDLGFDLGGWHIEGQDGGGWFFTIWQRQADGSWLWPLDMGAGRTKDASLVPSAGKIVIDPLPAETRRVAVKAFFEDIDAAHNLAITTDGPVKAAVRVLSSSALVTAGHLMPTGSQPDQVKILSERPLGGYATVGAIVSQAGDLACCYGQSLDLTGKPVGYYARLWRQEGAHDTHPRLVIDNFLKVT